MTSSENKISVYDAIHSVFRALATSFVLLAAPIAQYLFLRYYVHSVVGLRFGWEMVTDYSFIFSIPVAFTFLIWGILREKTANFQLSLKSLAFNILWGGSFLVLNHFFLSFSALYPTLAVCVWVFLAFATLLTSFCLLVSPNFYFSQTHPWLILPTLLIATSTAFGTKILGSYWPGFAAASASVSCAALSSVMGGVECFLTNDAPPVMIMRTANMAVRVSRTCGGMEGFLLFGYVYIALVMLVPRLMTITGWVVTLLSGFPLLSLLNIFRLTLFVGLGTAAHRWSSDPTIQESFLFLFHTHAGWIFYSIGIVTHFLICCQMARQLTLPAGLWRKRVPIKVEK